MDLLAPANTPVYVLVLGGGDQGDGVMAAEVRIDDGHMIQGSAKGVYFGSIVGLVHRVIEIDDELGRELSQGNGHLGIAQRDRAEQGGNGDVAIGAIEVKFVANPRLLMTLAVALAPDVTDGRQILEIVLE